MRSLHCIEREHRRVMPNALFPSAPTATMPPTEVQPADVPAVPVEANVDGNDTSKIERTYTAADLEQIVKDRLKRERKKLAGEYEPRIAELEKKLGTPGQQHVSPKQEDFQAKLTQF